MQVYTGSETSLYYRRTHTKFICSTCRAYPSALV